MKNWLKRVYIVALAAFGIGQVFGQALQPTGIGVTPGSALPGDTISVSVTVSNTGGTAFKAPSTANFTVLFTNVTTGHTFTVGPVSVQPSGLIGAATTDPTSGQQTAGVGSFLIPAIVPTQVTDAGNYTATVTLNSVSTGTGSGSLPAAAPVLTVTGKPDFQITRLTYQSGTSYVGGDVIPMSLSFRNAISTGGVYNVPYVSASNKTNKPVRIQVVLSNNPVFGDADDFQLTFFDITGNIDADGAEHTVSWQQLLPGNFSGSYYVLAKIDSMDVVDETGEAAAKPLETNVFLDVSATKLAIQPSAFPTLYVATMAGGATAGGYSDNPAISSDGRYTAFVSDAPNLVSGDTNNARDVFIYDNQTLLVRRLSVSQQGREANGASNNPSISGDGRYVAFASDATNLVFGDTNGFTDIFVVDTITGAITRESVSASGSQSNGASFRPVLSTDGRYIVFESTATNLVSVAVPVGKTQIYERDRNTGVTTLISQSTAGAAGNGSSLQAVLSSDGRYVAFASDASNLVAGDTNAARDVFLRDVTAGTTIRVSVGPAGVEATGGSSRTPAITQSGRYIAFASDATNLVPNDTNGVSDVFVYDRDMATTTRVSVSSSGAQATDSTDATVAGSAMGSFNPSISADGRYVAFASLADNLAPGDLEGQYYPAGSGNGALNIYVMDRSVDGSATYDVPGNIKTTNVSVNRFGYQAIYVLNVESTPAADIQPVISADGRWVAFPTDAEGAPGLIHGATNLISPDANSARDIVVFDRRINALPVEPTVPKVTISSPTNSVTYPVNSPVNVIADASTTVGSVASVQFFVNGTSLGTITSYPYVTTWTPTGTGTYTVSALATDSFGNQGVSNSVTVTVDKGSPPAVKITGPADGTTVTINGPQTLTADATSPNGTIKSVQFFSNGAAVGPAVTKAPYTATWTPLVAGAYTITASALDNGGQSTTSAPITVMAIPNAVANNSTYAGNYAGAEENGHFALVNVGGSHGSLIAYSNTTPTQIYFFPDVTITSSGAFTGVDSTGKVSVSGSVGDTGVSGTIDGSRLTFIGPIATTLGTAPSVAGYYSGSLAGNANSNVAAIVGPDRSINLSVSDGTTLDAGTGNVDSTGAFTVTTALGSKLTGKIDPASGFLTATATGKTTGSVLAAMATGPAFSDGALRNLSTRGQVGTGGNVLIAGFVVAGSTPKQVLIRAIGPSLTPYGITGALADPQLQLYKVSTLIGGNNDWGNDPAIAAASSKVGAFGLSATSKDAALLVTLPPGNYNAVVSGVGDTTGVALVEIYDVDSATPFTAQKVMNVSTRGLVGTGQSQLIAGFVVSGNIAKKLLIRAVGPSLASVGVTSGLLADPMLRLSRNVNGVDTAVRENNDWGQGNDPALITDATAKVGAFPLTDGGKDAAMLITLPPGTYSAQVTGANGTSGIALIEVYEVP